MDVQTGLRSLSFGLDHGTGDCTFVFFGGEPLLQERLLRTLVEQGREMALRRHRPVSFRTSTNGLLLDASFLDFAASNDVSIAMSFDGVREAHDRHRRLPSGVGTHDVLVERLEALLGCMPNSAVHLVVNPDTVDLLAESVAYVVSLGCRYLCIYLNYDTAWRNDDWSRLGDQYEAVAALYAVWRSEGDPFRLDPFDRKIASVLDPACYETGRCKYGRNEVAVGPRGQVYPCVQFVYSRPSREWVIGDVATGFVTEAYRRMIDGSTEASEAGERCIACAYRNRCIRFCACLNYRTTGSVSEVSTTVCRHERTLIPIVDRMLGAGQRGPNPRFLDHPDSRLC